MKIGSCIIKFLIAIITLSKVKPDFTAGIFFIAFSLSFRNSEKHVISTSVIKRF